MDHDLACIDLATAHFKFEGARETAARELGYSPARFWQIVNALVDRPDIIALRPAQTRRLRGLREARRGVRTG